MNKPSKQNLITKRPSPIKHDLENILDSISDIITIHDSDFNIVYANKAAKKNLGLPSLNGKKLKCYKYYHGQETQLKKCPSCKCMKTGKPAAFKMFEPNLNMFVEIKVVPRFDSKGKITGLIHIVRNITGYNQIEQQVKELAAIAEEEEAKSNAIMAAIGDGISIQDTDFVILFENQRQKDMVGDHVGEYCYKAYQGRDRVCENCHLAMSFKEGRIHKLEQSRTTDAGPRHYEITASPLMDPDGNIVAGIEIVRDITERKLIEAELQKHRDELMLLVEDRTAEGTASNERLIQELTDRRQAEHNLKMSERKYRNLYDNAPDMYHSLNMDKTIIDCNETEAGILGYRKEEIIGRPLSDFFTEESVKLLEADFPVLKKEKTLKNIERTYVRKDGTTFPAIINVFAMFDDKGEMVGTRAIARDITEIKELQKREAMLLKELKMIFENLPVGIVYLSRNYEIVSMNKYLYDFTGFAEGELTGKFCYEVLGEYANDPARKGHGKICSFCKKDECFKNKKPAVMERPLKDKFVRVTTVPEIDEKGEILRFLEAVEDITERKLAETEVIRAGHLASLGELAAGVAHEINNPVNGILNYAQMIVNKNSPESKEYDISTRIIKESERIANIVRGLLSFARDSSEKKCSVNIHEIICGILALIEAQLRKDGISLTVEIPSDLPAVTVISQQIEQVVLNIISNARYALNRKYPEKHIDKTLVITGKKVRVNKTPHIRLTFHDRGTGIPPEILNKVMNPFFSTKPANAGTGLGLSISHGIISSHGGKIMIDSVYGEYTKIIVELPI